MFDPISISIAIATAQSAVNQIKQARALGKDISQLIGEFGKFFSASTEVYIATNKLRTEKATRSNSEIYKMALEIAYAAKTCRENERELKDMLIYSGNGDVYEDMMKARVQLGKQRAEAQRQIEEHAQKRKQELANIFINGLLFLAVCVVLLPIGAAIFILLTK